MALSLIIKFANNTKKKSSLRFLQGNKAMVILQSPLDSS